jgi:hypothetical protein
MTAFVAQLGGTLLLAFVLGVGSGVFRGWWR